MEYASNFTNILCLGDEADLRASRHFSVISEAGLKNYMNELIYPVIHWI